jgi:hypothetical protein
MEIQNKPAHEGLEGGGADLEAEPRKVRRGEW